MVTYQNETIRLKATIKTIAGVLIDPATIQITITDSAGLQVVVNQSMTYDSLGMYHYDYFIAANAPLGLWIYQVTASSGKPSIEKGTFYVNG